MAANDVAELGGIFQNRSYFARTFPALWRMVTMYVCSDCSIRVVLVSLHTDSLSRVKVVFWRLMIGLFMFMGRKIWSEMTRLVEDPQTYEEAEDVSGIFSLS